MLMTRPDPISLRLPEALRASIQAAAQDSGRSLNAEIRMRLEWSFSEGFNGNPSEKMLANEVESLRAEIRGSEFAVTEELKDLKDRIAALEARNQ
jgi:hypothetical protein